MRKITVFTVEESLLTGGWCIDIGCRGFAFAEEMKKLGCQVVGLDVQKMDPPDGIRFINKAVTSKDGDHVGIIHSHDKEAVCIDTTRPGHTGQERIETVSCKTLFSTLGGIIDVLKLNCEASEYEILSDPEFPPTARQIVASFHEHTHPELHRQYFDRVLKVLARNYTPRKLDRYEDHGSGMNYWDCLFVRTDLISI